MATNPFSTRFTRPGAIPFLFPEGESAATVVDRFRQHRWQGQLIGPHGSGKSTLLATLRPELEAAGRQILAVTLHQGEHRLPPLDRGRLSTTTLLLIDGYEQLSWWSRWRVKWICRRYGAGLLVTAHTDVGLPTVFQTETDKELVQSLVARLVGADTLLITDAETETALAATGGNVREVFFRLYDVYQRKISQPATK